MLNESIKNLRKSKGISQEELAIKLNVVRQTVSKWENGLSVPDSDMLITLASELETTVSVLLGETISKIEENDIEVISKKLEDINLQLAKRKIQKIKTIRCCLISLCAIIVLIFIGLYLFQSDYLNWDYNDPETAILGTMFHSFEFFFVRVAPIVFILLIIGIVYTCKK